MFTGPYEILARSEDGKTYEIEMPVGIKGDTRKVVNVDNLKPVIYEHDAHMFHVTPREYGLADKVHITNNVGPANNLMRLCL